MIDSNLPLFLRRRRNVGGGGIPPNAFRAIVTNQAEANAFVDPVNVFNAPIWFDIETDFTISYIPGDENAEQTFTWNAIDELAENNVGYPLFPASWVTPGELTQGINTATVYWK